MQLASGSTAETRQLQVEIWSQFILAIAKDDRRVTTGMFHIQLTRLLILKVTGGSDGESRSRECLDSLC